MQDGDIVTLVVLFIVIAFISLVAWAVPVRLYIEALSAGARVGMGNLIGMRLRKVTPAAVVRPLIWATKAGIPLNVDELEAHYLAGGEVDRVVRALISADKANIDMGFQQAAAIDLAGRDVFEAVQVSVNPKVINTPKVAAMAKDGIQLIAQARVTVRANINRLVGGAGEDTILARVGEGIVSCIGSAETHKEVLENPDEISKTVLAKGLDSGTAFEILSIDIADVDVGKNIGADLQTHQAEADKRVAQARAEERRAMAVAQEQEMKAKVEEMRAELVKAEAQVPLALAQALRDGHMGVMDYVRYNNIQSDTSMRQAIAAPEEDDPEPLA
ncbi:MAG: flotillin-like protein FloA [Gemmatimonadetes bacterium]|nr:flotillin-like protein FloA [Gemmatimonadota bacterium]